MRMGNRYAWLGALFVASVVSGVACSSSDSNNPDGTKDGGGGEGGGGGGEGGGGGGDESLKQGNVLLMNSKLSFGGTTVESYSATAAFSDFTGVTGGGGLGGGGVNCTSSTEGACKVLVCDFPTNDAGGIDAGDDDDGGTGNQVKSVSAGDIAISSANISPALKLEPDSDNTYDTVSDDESIWVGGEPITFKAEGSANGVPAFEKTLNAPALATLTSPTWQGAGPTIPRTQDLSLAWTLDGAGAGKVTVFLSSFTNGKSVTATCTFPAGDNQGKIPASVLGKYPAGQGSFSMNNDEESSFKVSDWSVTTTLRAPGVREGGPAVATPTFQ